MKRGWGVDMKYLIGGVGGGYEVPDWGGGGWRLITLYPFLGTTYPPPVPGPPPGSPSPARQVLLPPSPGTLNHSKHSAKYIMAEMAAKIFFLFMQTHFYFFLGICLHANKPAAPC